MSTRTISRVALTSSLRLARLPLDLAIAFLPAGGRQAARSAVDQADANVRALAAAILSDDVLREDAQRRYAPTAARERAADLRGEAAKTAERADERVEERHRDAVRRHRTADKRARTRREAAGERKQQRARQAAKTERQRVQATRQTESAVERAIEEEAPRARLQALDSVAEAQRERDAALAEMDEAQRLQEAAERVKEERKKD
jgi:hypothetical protein